MEAFTQYWQVTDVVPVLGRGPAAPEDAPTASGTGVNEPGGGAAAKFALPRIAKQKLRRGLACPSWKQKFALRLNRHPINPDCQLSRAKPLLDWS